MLMKIDLRDICTMLVTHCDFMHYSRLKCEFCGSYVIHGFVWLKTGTSGGPL
jgi:hypothetical protein